MKLRIFSLAFSCLSLASCEPRAPVQDLTAQKLIELKQKALGGDGVAASSVALHYNNTDDRINSNEWWKWSILAADLGDEWAMDAVYRRAQMEAVSGTDPTSACSRAELAKRFAVNLNKIRKRRKIERDLSNISAFITKSCA